jgi:cob(I)alamin adenosyltransferase
MPKFRLYTGSGDDGYTQSPLVGARVPKDHSAIELEGGIDEALAAIGLARSLLPEELNDIGELLLRCQLLLYRLGTTILTRSQRQEVGEADVKWLEGLTDEKLEEVQLFLVPGGHPAAAALHIARTAVRRLERVAVKALREAELEIPIATRLLNRLGDALFALTTHINKRTGHTEEVYRV